MVAPLQDTVQIGWQVYRRIGLCRHCTRMGRQTNLIRFEACCAEPKCGRRFEAKATATDWRRKRLVRRCEDHRSVGRAVNSLEPPVPLRWLPPWAQPRKGWIEATARKRRYARPNSQRAERPPPRPPRAFQSDHARLMALLD